ncbi:glutaredoxin 3 [Lycorma delicatula]|uniref:glutaredoxin 3 n=1 Tax=Lycorma delicatula TaxID=130591 RepID=UPI003F515AB3
MVVLDLSRKEEFDKETSGSELVVVHFYADWAEQCQHMNTVLEELSLTRDLKIVKFAKCQAEELPEVSAQFAISAVPTFIILHSGKLVDRVDGANPTELSKKVKAHVAKFASVLDQKPINLETRLKTLINSASVMLFMKGSRQEPKCGFSRQIVQILDSFNADYKTFDILTDNEVREGLKKYSNWPTYPQLYINGELIGGVDIVKELVESSELKGMLPVKEKLEDRLKALTHKSDIMIFMKGSRDIPRCGFSRQLMEILKEIGVTFETFDILENEEVRQGLKTYSNWPTYPQVYVKGELVGGLDIIKELNESGELKNTLEPKS